MCREVADLWVNSASSEQAPIVRPAQSLTIEVVDIEIRLWDQRG